MLSSRLFERQTERDRRDRVMLIKNNKFYFENKQEQEQLLEELQNRWQRLMNTCREVKGVRNIFKP